MNNSRRIYRAAIYVDYLRKMVILMIREKLKVTVSLIRNP